MNISILFLAMNYMVSFYGALCLFNSLHGSSYGMITNMFHSTNFLSKPLLKMNPDDMKFIRTSIAYGNYGEEWSYQDLISNAQYDNIEFVSIMNNANMLVALDNKHGRDFSTDNLHYVRIVPDLLQHIVDTFVQNNVQFVIDNFNTTNSFSLIGLFIKTGGIVFTYGIIVVFFSMARMFLMRYLQNTKVKSSSGTNLIGISSIAKRGIFYQEPIAKTMFSDVAGCDEAKFELQEVVDFLKNPARYNEAGAIIPKGVLLEGPPGTGKTLLARATAGEADVSFISKSGSDFVEVFVGVGASRMRDLFNDAKKMAPCIIFIDEIDAIGKSRSHGSGNDEKDQTLNQLLTNMDGFEKNENIIVIASTNRADILDKALLRPGRFDRKVRVGLPDRQGRKEILDVHLKGKRIDRCVDLESVYDLTTGFSGADLANLVNEAAIMSVRNNISRIDMKSFNDAYEKTTIGLPKSKDLRDEKTREMVAFHESGHAIVAKSFHDFVDVRKVTINANNNGAGGYTLFTPKERYVSFPSRKYMFASLVIAMAGRAAEIILFNSQHNALILDKEPKTKRGRQTRATEYSKNKSTKTNADMNQEFIEAQMNVFISTLDNDVDGSPQVTLGSSSDVRRATEIARQYISVFGTNDALGAGLEWNEQSERVKGEIDERIATLIVSAQNMAVSILDRREIDLQNLSSLLLEKGTVSGNEVP